MTGARSLRAPPAFESVSVSGRVIGRSALVPGQVSWRQNSRRAARQLQRRVEGDARRYVRSAAARVGEHTGRQDLGSGVLHDAQEVGVDGLGPREAAERV